jgi:TetR/AcrR family transcriptional repressor of bet genes
MPRPSNTNERRAEIVDALLAVMAKRGYEGASIGDIAKRARLAPGLVHYHFANKLEILVEAVRAMTTAHEAALDTAIDRDACAHDRLGQLIDVHLGLGAHADPARLACWVQVAGEALRHEVVRVELEAALAAIASRVRAIVEQGVAARELACDDPRAAAAAIVAAIEGYFVLAATTKRVIPRGSAAACVRAMAGGLIARRGKARA